MTLKGSDPLSNALHAFAKGHKIIPVLGDDKCFLNALGISDVRPILQQASELLQADIDRLPLNLLDNPQFFEDPKGHFG